MARVTSTQRLAAELLAEGHNQKRVAEMLSLHPHTITRWKRNNDFQALIDELSAATGAASKAERIRIAKRVVRQKMQSESWSKKDLLDWLRYIREETVEENPAVNVNLLIANSFNQLPPEQRPAAMLELARSLFAGSSGTGQFGQFGLEMPGTGATDRMSFGELGQDGNENEGHTTHNREMLIDEL